MFGTHRLPNSPPAVRPALVQVVPEQLEHGWARPAVLGAPAVPYASSGVAAAVTWGGHLEQELGERQGPPARNRGVVRAQGHEAVSEAVAAQHAGV